MKKNNTKEEFSAEFLEHLNKSIEDILNGDKGVELDLDKLDKELDEICKIKGIRNTLKITKPAFIRQRIDLDNDSEDLIYFKALNKKTNWSADDNMD